jgi:hypothetical protein
VDFEKIILSTLPVASRADFTSICRTGFAHFGLPVTAVVAKERTPSNVAEDSAAPVRA